jgi:hypothetical protein
MFGMYPLLVKLYGGYRAVAKLLMARVNVEIFERSDHAKGFAVLPKQWVTSHRRGEFSSRDSVGWEHKSWPVSGRRPPASLNAGSDRR